MSGELTPRREVAMRENDSGLTLLEVMVTITVFGILCAMAIPGWRMYERSAGQKGTAQQTTALLRSVAQRAIAEDTAYCARFTSSAVALWRNTCGTGTSLGNLVTAQSNSSFASASFTQSDGVTVAADLYFYPRGEATAGSVQVTRPSTSKVYTISVQGLSGHVTLA
jgi:prepilin-type N-terminal cleavage/methylation domain-containing protein